MMDRSRDSDFFSPAEKSRYSRQISLPHVGVEGQQKLKQGSVLIVGSGGLGSPSSIYLTAAGVGRLGLVDFDRVDLSNLHRQVLHQTGDVGRPKVESAKEHLTALNPEVVIEVHETRLTSENAMDILRSYDVVIDGSDNFATRYLINDACVLLGKPNVYGSVFRFEGQASVFDARSGPCYRCLYAEPPPPGFVPSCEEGGVFGVLPGIIGLIQATEAIKILLEEGTTLAGRLLLFDALRMSFRELRLKKDSQCKICGDQPTITALIDYDQFCGTGQSMNAPDNALKEITPADLSSRLSRGEKIVLLDVREPAEWEGGRLENAVHIPMRRLMGEVGTLDKSADIVVYCRTGRRSATAIEMMRSMGFEKLQNLQGGITRWAADVDPSIVVY